MGLFDRFKSSHTKSTVNSRLETKDSQETNASSGDDIIPVEQRVKGSQSTCDGLFPHEILVLSYATSERRLR